MQWKADGVGVVVHRSGAAFVFTRAGWIGVETSAGQSESELAELVRELRQVMAHTWPHRAPARHRLH